MALNSILLKDKPMRSVNLKAPGTACDKQMFSWYSLNLFSISVPVLSARQHLKINFWCRLWEEVTLWKRNVLEHWGGVVQFMFWTLNKLLQSRGSNEVKALNRDNIYTVWWNERIIPILVGKRTGNLQPSGWNQHCTAQEHSYIPKTHTHSSPAIQNMLTFLHSYGLALLVIPSSLCFKLRCIHSGYRW